jgi:hypothetical protein
MPEMGEMFKELYDATSPSAPVSSRNLSQEKTSGASRVSNTDAIKD